MECIPVWLCWEFARLVARHDTLVSSLFVGSSCTWRFCFGTPLSVLLPELNNPRHHEQEYLLPEPKDSLRHCRQSRQ